MHTDKFMIRLCLEIVLQFTHEEEKELYVKQNSLKQFFPKSFMQLHILHEIHYISGFSFMLIYEIEEGFVCIRRKSHALENRASCFTVAWIQ